MDTWMGTAELGVLTFFASSHDNDACGANGLPLTPNSIRILGNFQKLKKIRHPHLCKYIDCIRSKHERLIIVSEHYQNNLQTEYESGRFKSLKNFTNFAHELVTALALLEENNIVHRTISPTNVLFDEHGKVKLSGYGIYNITEGGYLVSFPVGNPQYIAPEVIGQEFLTSSHHEATMSGSKVDIWSLGMLLLHTWVGKLDLFDSVSCSISRLLEVTESNNPLSILTESDTESKFQELPKNFQNFIQHCLKVSPRERPSASVLLGHDIFTNVTAISTLANDLSYPFTDRLRCKNLTIPTAQDVKTMAYNSDTSVNLTKVYHLWQLAGGDLEGILKKHGLIKTRPPISTIPDFISDHGEMFGLDMSSTLSLQQTVLTLPLEQLRHRLRDIRDEAFYVLLEADNDKQTDHDNTTQTADLPLVIKERDIEYQFHRILLFERLLEAFPYKSPHIYKEARVDIPPFVRAHVWAAVLEVYGDVQKMYDAVDKKSPMSIDRQIEVDIPRCHQYDELLSSPEGHKKLKYVLKAWIVSNPQYVYWQGLDSLCAPFVYLNFNDEALAFASLSKFISKYLHKFFLRDNSAIIQEYLAVFSHLIAFHEPELSSHMEEIGFIPDLYAIPWFLTMYAHVFPLHKLFHLWDTLILGNSSFPLFIGVAILLQLKDRLLTYGFNECILLFSDMPEINIQNCVKDSIRLFCITPKSATYRQHGRPTLKLEDTNKSSRPIVSYYSRDYQDQIPNELSMEPIPLEDLKCEQCPRISADDLLELTELKTSSSNTRSPVKKSVNSRPKLIVIDVRTQDEFIRGTLPGSVNIPYDTAFTADCQIGNSADADIINSHKSQIKVIVGGRGKSALNFAHNLLKLGYNKVCVLHRGIDGLRSTGLLSVSSSAI